MTEFWTERDGHDSNITGELTDEVCNCGERMYFYETGRIPPTRYEPGEVLGYFECHECGERFSL